MILNNKKLWESSKERPPAQGTLAVILVGARPVSGQELCVLLQVLCLSHNGHRSTCDKADTNPPHSLLPLSCGLHHLPCLFQEATLGDLLVECSLSREQSGEGSERDCGSVLVTTARLKLGLVQPHS